MGFLVKCTWERMTENSIIILLLLFTGRLYRSVNIRLHREPPGEGLCSMFLRLTWPLMLCSRSISQAGRRRHWVWPSQQRRSPVRAASAPSLGQSYWSSGALSQECLDLSRKVTWEQAAWSSLERCTQWVLASLVEDTDNVQDLFSLAFQTRAPSKIPSPPFYSQKGKDRAWFQIKEHQKRIEKDAYLHGLSCPTCPRLQAPCCSRMLSSLNDGSRKQAEKVLGDCDRKEKCPEEDLAGDLATECHREARWQHWGRSQRNGVTHYSHWYLSLFCMNYAVFHTQFFLSPHLPVLRNNSGKLFFRKLKKMEPDIIILVRSIKSHGEYCHRGALKFVSYSVFESSPPTFILEASTVSGTFGSLYIKGPNSLRTCLQALQHGASNI